MENLNTIYEDILKWANEKIDWYHKSKRTKRKYALSIRYITIAILVAAGLIPILDSAFEFENKGEPWNRYSLEDGTTMKMKVVLLDVKRIEGEYSEDGNPVYQIQAQYIMGIDAPDNLKKKN